MCCSLAVSYCSLHLGNKLECLLLLFSCVNVCERMSWGGGGLYSLCTFFFFLSFELFSLNWINPVGQSEIFVCGNCLTAVSCTQDPQH